MRFKGVYKAAKLIKVTMEVEDGRIKFIRITGDFFMYPEDSIRSLEAILIGSRLEEEVLEKRIRKFLLTENVQVPLITPQDFVKAIISAKPEVR